MRNVMRNVECETGKGGGRGSEGANLVGGKTIREQRQVLLDSVARLQESLLDPPSALLADHYRSEIERHQATLKLLDEQESKEREEAANQALAAAEEEIAKGKEAAKDHVDDGTPKATTTTTYNKKRKGDTDSETMVSGADEAKGHSSGLDTMESSTTAPEHSYELYSVLVHSGSATGGHYYAYIKSFEKNKWYVPPPLPIRLPRIKGLDSSRNGHTHHTRYEFNDSYVTEVSEEKVKQAYGTFGVPRQARVHTQHNVTHTHPLAALTCYLSSGSDGSSSIMGTSWGCSAYMLCYRCRSHMSHRSNQTFGVRGN
jgi:hypothetical protein